MFDDHTLLLKLKTDKISHLTNDSRMVIPGSAFFAYPGHGGSDGRHYISEAIKRGASAVFWEANNYRWNYNEWSVYNHPIDDLKYKLGYFANAFYGSPSHKMPVIAITGTNGKTSIVHFIAQLLSTSHNKVGTIGTLGAGLWSDLSPLDNTTPDSIRMHQLFKKFVDDHFSTAVIEASSHGIFQGRINGINITTAVFANAQSDHLDFHKNLENYWQSKAKLFDIPSVKIGILNADDSFCVKLAAHLQSRLSIYTYGKAGHDLRLLSVQSNQTDSVISVDGCLGKRQFHVNFIGQYNIDNFMAAALSAHLNGISGDRIEQISQTLTLPMGRMQKISNSPNVYVDFAHTPNAMAAVLNAVRKQDDGKLWVVFGCGGNRDKTKRPQMGAIATQYADFVIVTDDNPRDEDPAAIRSEIMQSAPNAYNIGSREEAIATAIKQSKNNDVILILGKGHEQSQTIKGKQLYFSDAQIAKKQVESLLCS